MVGSQSITTTSWLIEGPLSHRLTDSEWMAQALVLGETLCPLQEARDLPVDMVYALLVDFHRDVEHAGPLIDFIEETNRAFAPGTMALAYFENHDSPRANAVGRERFEELLRRDEAARGGRHPHDRSGRRPRDETVL